MITDENLDSLFDELSKEIKELSANNSFILELENKNKALEKENKILNKQNLELNNALQNFKNNHQNLQQKLKKSLGKI